MNNGNVHQIDLSEIENIRTANFEEHPIVHATEGSSLINLHVIDLLEGKLQTITDRKYSNTNARDSPLTVAKISTAGSSENSNEHSLITDNGNKSSSTSENTVISSSNCVHQQSRDGNSLHHGTSSSVSSSSTVISKRMIAIGKGEYQRQQNPHLLICTSTRSISVFMTGYNIKLVSKELNETSIVHSEVIITQHGSCLCVLLDNGRLAFLSLPHLEPMLERSLPNSCLLDRLNEAFLTQDGRIVFWTGDYELEQYSVIQKANFPIGESVILFNAQKSIPPQSCTSRMQQKPKKSWIDAVAGAFQKEPLTVEEFDLLMGRMPVEDPNEIRKQKVEAYKAKMKQQETAGDTGNNSSNVFAQLGQKMNERGEKLNELDKKFQDMNAASGDFLKAIRDYNERQARKKWWEF
ncbi:hypothetical protein BDF20DRAFT_816536 [Mycotypha africana]|uniref:uncharacterized protein n=1 Tax=Mycotypha africana TaxID=64632 RepID=UPI0023002580|nr:uncharacterized protein BDF20DRAFT_816536 [Mycotypha africana]KAI8984676.1 hypothetical protein BDF20DRAFT_816536 [Mycotypha africana]